MLPNEVVDAYFNVSELSRHIQQIQTVEAIHTEKPGWLAKRIQDQMLALLAGREYNAEDAIQNENAEMQQSKFGDPVKPDDATLLSLGFVKKDCQETKE